MKKIQQKLRTLNNWKENMIAPTACIARNIALAGVVILAVGATQKAVADTEYEWDSTWGLHEEEWYDPSDWFNEDNKIDYEDTANYSYDDSYYYGTANYGYGYYGTANYGYDDSYYYDGIWDGYDYWDSYGYNSYGYNDYYYQWSPADLDWTEVKADESKEKSKEMKKKDIDKKDVLTMRGTIKSFGTAKTKGSKMNHTFVVLETAKDKNVLVDFGPKAKIGKIKLKEGNKIQVTGPRTKLSGQFVLVAQQVSGINPDKE